MKPKSSEIKSLDLQILKSNYFLYRAASPPCYLFIVGKHISLTPHAQNMQCAF